MKLYIFILTILPSITCFADNGHLIGTAHTEDYRVAIFAEPWPARVGELQLQSIVTDTEGNLVLDESILSMPQQSTITLEEVGTYTLDFQVDGQEQDPITFEILPKESMYVTYWLTWLFIILGLIFIILREKLAKKSTRRYPSI
jgi:hypothetical protein